MRVLIIPEDFRKDQYILKPIFERLFRAIGRPRAHIEVCQEPLLGGVDEALKSDRISEIVSFYPMTGVFDVIRQKCPEDFDHLALRLSHVSG